MDTLPKMTVIRQSLFLLPTRGDAWLPFDHYVKKLTIAKTLKLAVVGNLLRWESYSEYEEQLRASTDLQDLLQLPSISASQISRRFNRLPTVLLADLFYSMMSKIKDLHRPTPKGLLQRVGPLKVIDASCLKLPSFLADWAYVTKDRTGVKMHVAYSVTSPEMAYPSEIIPSTGNVSDYEGSDDLLVQQGVTYVLDRGYVCYDRMDRWVDKGLHYVIRIADHHIANIIEEQPVQENSRICRDAIVRLGSNYTAMEHPVRLVEFHDEKGRLYRIVTTRRDDAAEDIAEIYRHRWLIELFFKWLKQHLRLVKLQSTHPQGIWNHIYLSMISYALALYIRLKHRPNVSAWNVLRLFRIYATKEQSWERFVEALNREPARKSKGRVKTDKPRAAPDLDNSVARIKGVKEKNIVSKSNKKPGIPRKKNTLK